MVLDEGYTRSVSMHLATGSPSSPSTVPLPRPQPHGLGEAALAAETGEVLAGGDDDPVSFATRAERDAALAQAAPRGDRVP